MYHSLGNLRAAFPPSWGVGSAFPNSSGRGPAAPSALRAKEVWLGVMGTVPSFCRRCLPKNEPPISEFLEGLLKIQIPGPRPSPVHRESQGIEHGNLYAYIRNIYRYSSLGDSYLSWRWRTTVLEGKAKLSGSSPPGPVLFISHSAWLTHSFMGKEEYPAGTPLPRGRSQLWAGGQGCCGQALFCPESPSF